MEVEDEEKCSDEEGQLKDDETEGDVVDGLSLKQDHNQVACQFFGSFYNDRSNEEPCVELLSYSQPVRLTEIRVIPLGATVVLSSGVPQLGSTNPEKFDLDFYYQDATEPTRSTFKSISRFRYEEKSSIQLFCSEDENPIFTTKLLVKGLYNSLTLATYGYAVEAKDIPIKPPPPIEIKLEPVLSPDLPHDDHDEKEYIDEGTTIKQEISIKDEPQDSRRDSSPEMEIDEDVEMKDTFDTREDDLPQAIPTITTRVNFTATRNFPALERRGSKGTVSLVRDPLEKVEPFSSDEDPFDEPTPSGGSPAKSTVQLTLGTDDIGAEDISDGEISSGSEDVLTAPYIPPSSDSPEAKGRDLSPGDDRTTQPLATAHDGLSDHDFEEDFTEPAVEEILSDEEMHYADSEDDFDLAEYEEALGDQFGQPLSLDSFKIPTLKHLSIDNYVLKSVPVDKSLQQNFQDGLKKYSKKNFEPSMLESWVQFLEQLLPFFSSSIPTNLAQNAEVVETLCYWVRKGIEVDSATTQAALTFNVRRIKVGLKLIHCACSFSNFLANEILEIKLDENGTSLQHKLFQLLTDTRNDTPLIQNLILKAFDATLTTIRGYTSFTDDKLGEMSIHEQILDYVMEKRRSRRFEFAFAWFLRKICVIRFLVSFEDKTNEMDPDEMMNGLGFLIESMENIEHSPGYPLRFLPAQTVLEIPHNSSWNPRLSFIKVLKECNFLKSCCTVLGASSVHPVINESIRRIFACLLSWETGLIYLCEESTMSLWKHLRSSYETEFLTYFAHCLEVAKCADTLSLNTNSTSQAPVALDESMDALHCVYLALASPAGRKAITKTFSIDNFVLPLVQCIKDGDMESLRDCDKLSALERSTMNEYAVELLCYIVKTSDNFQFLRSHGSELFRIITSLNEDHEGYDKLNDLIPFLKPTLDPGNFTLDGIDILSEILKTKLDGFLEGPRTADSHWGFTPEVVTILRILNGLGLVPEDLDQIDDISIIPSNNPDPPAIKEMKYTIGYVRMHSADIVTTLSTLLSKIIKEFEQPALYAYAFVRAKGDALVSIVLPIVRILRKILTEVIQVRNTSFRDMTQVPLLLQTYGIFDSFPSTSVSLKSANTVKQHIVAALQAYTTPVMKLGEESEQELTKSIWTLMISELIKFTLTSPCNFIPGLTIMSELLPLPLPVFCNEFLDEQSELKLISLRRMWSAFLHGVTAQLQELIGTLCETTHPELMTLLRWVCLQLADLSPSTCLVVCRAIMDPIVTSIESDLEARTKESLDPSSSVTAWVEVANDRRNVQCSARTTRLLGFLATLMRKHGVIKAGVMHAFRATAKGDEKFADFMSMLSCILANSSDQKTPSSSHVMGQIHVLTIFHSLCNVKLNMLMLPDYSVEAEIDMDYFKANTLPMKDNINLMSTSLLTFLNLQENILGNVAVIRKIFFTLNTFCDTEYGFFHLRAALSRNPGVIHNFLVKLRTHEFQNLDIVGVMESLEVVDSILRFLMILISPQLSRQDCVDLRRSVLSVSELRKCLSWPTEPAKQIPPIESDNSEYSSQLENHPMTHLELYLKKVISSGHEDSQGGEEQQYLKTYMSEAQEKLNVVTGFLGKIEESEPPALVEVSLMPPDTLTDLFSHRPVTICNESQSQCRTLNTSFNSIEDTELERGSDDLILCDITELSKMYLNNIDILRELEIAANLEVQGEKPGDPSGPNRDIHSKPRYDLLSTIRSGPAPYGHGPRKMPYNNSVRGVAGRGGFGRGMMGNAGRGSPHFDPFRSRPPNTSRPPSLHVDDFVALESSGQGSSSSSVYNKGGRPNEPYRGRGSRGSPVGNRPFNNPPPDRGRPFRSSGSGFFSQQRNDSTPPRSRGRGNRSFGSGQHERWQGSSDSRGSSGSGGNFGGRQEHRNYDRPSGQARGTGSTRQSYGRGSSYRDGPGSGGTRSAPSTGNSNATASQRWRDKPRQFNR